MACCQKYFHWLLLCILPMLKGRQAANSQLATQLAMIAQKSFAQSDQCTFLFENPKDFVHLSHDRQIFRKVQQSQSVIMGSDLSKALIAVNKCLLVVSTHDNIAGLNRTIDTVTTLPFHVALVLLFDSDEKAHSILNHFKNKRLKIDLYSITTGSNMSVVKYILVSQNPAWNTVKYTFVSTAPAFSFSKDGNHGGEEWAFLEELSKRTGVSYKLLPSRNSFNGMMEMVANGEADLTMCHSAYSYKRYKLVGGISTAIGERRFALAAKKPSPMSAEWTLTYPFDVYIWTMLGLSMALVLVLLRALAASIPGFNRTSNFHLFSLSISVIINEAMPPGFFSIRFLRRSGLLFLFAWLPSSYIISLAYRSTLLASLVAIKYEDAVDTWQELLDTDITLVIPSNQIHNELIKTSNREIIQKVYQKNVLGKGGLHRHPFPPDVLKTIDDGLAINIIALDKQAESKHIYSLKGDILEHSPFGCYFTPKFPWRQQLDLVLINLQEVGFVDWFNDNELFQKSKAYRQLERTKSTLVEERKLSMTHMRLTWIVLIVGIIPSIFGFACETFQSSV